MNMREEFERIMREQREIALATTTDGLPHVRIVNFYYAPEERRAYFATFKDNEKVVELAANPNIAFTTVPHNDTNEHVRASGHAVKSAHTDRLRPRGTVRGENSALSGDHRCRRRRSHPLRDCLRGGGRHRGYGAHRAHPTLRRSLPSLEPDNFCPVPHVSHNGYCKYPCLAWG